MPVAGQGRGSEGERARHGREVCGDAASGAPEVYAVLESPAAKLGFSAPGGMEATRIGA